MKTPIANLDDFAALVLDRCFDLAVHHDPAQGTVVLEYASAARSSLPEPHTATATSLF